MCSAGAERDVHFVRDVACSSDVHFVREAEHITSLCADGAIHHCAITRHHIGKVDTSFFLAPPPLLCYNTHKGW